MERSTTFAMTTTMSKDGLMSDLSQKDSVRTCIVGAAKKNTIGYIKKKQSRISPQQVNFKDSEGNAALHYACINRNVEMARLLLQLGADPNTRNKQGNTPLHEAFKIDSLPVFCG